MKLSQGRAWRPPDAPRRNDDTGSDSNNSNDTNSNNSKTSTLNTNNSHGNNINTNSTSNERACKYAAEVQFNAEIDQHSLHTYSDVSISTLTSLMLISTLKSTASIVYT